MMLSSHRNKEQHTGFVAISGSAKLLTSGLRGPFLPGVDWLNLFKIAFFLRLHRRIHFLLLYALGEMGITSKEKQ